MTTVRVLGCSGGIGDRLGEGMSRTTALLIDDDVLVDCGTGVGDMELDQLAKIDHVFLTHAHLDHIAGLPLLIDTVCDIRSTPLQVYAPAETIDALQRHIFNWAIWPDFNKLSEHQQPMLSFVAISVGQTIAIPGRQVIALPADHTVPALGYAIDSGAAALAFTGDTGGCDAFWQVVNRMTRLRHLIIETAFPDEDAERARVSKHLCPATLFAELAKLTQDCELHITHLKPGQGDTIMRQIAALVAQSPPGSPSPPIVCRRPNRLRQNQVIEF